MKTAHLLRPAAAPAQRRRRAGTSACDVLGGNLASSPPATATAVPGKWRWHHHALTALRDRLRRERGDLARSSVEEQPSFSLHMADAATDEFDRDLILSELAAEQDLLYEVEEALARILSGGYGCCELTGQPIPAARLRAIPWTRFSRPAETQLERQGAVPRARVPALVSVQRATFPAATMDGEDEDSPVAQDERLGSSFVPAPTRPRRRQ